VDHDEHKVKKSLSSGIAAVPIFDNDEIDVRTRDTSIESAAYLADHRQKDVGPEDLTNCPEDQDETEVKKIVESASPETATICSTESTNPIQTICSDGSMNVSKVVSKMEDQSVEVKVKVEDRSVKVEVEVEDRSVEVQVEVVDRSVEVEVEGRSVEVEVEEKAETSKRVRFHPATPTPPERSGRYLHKRTKTSLPLTSPAGVLIHRMIRKKAQVIVPLIRVPLASSTPGPTNAHVFGIVADKKPVLQVELKSGNKLNKALLVLQDTDSNLATIMLYDQKAAWIDESIRVGDVVQVTSNSSLGVHVKAVCLFFSDPLPMFSLSLSFSLSLLLYNRCRHVFPVFSHQYRCNGGQWTRPPEWRALGELRGRRRSGETS
jgi:hypothetical protein